VQREQEALVQKRRAESAERLRRSSNLGGTKQRVREDIEGARRRRTDGSRPVVQRAVEERRREQAMLAAAKAKVSGLLQQQAERAERERQREQDMLVQKYIQDAAAREERDRKVRGGQRSPPVCFVQNSPSPAAL
jgi:hypothetical protein